MNTLSGSFTVKIDGKPIAKVGPGTDDRMKATIGPDAAVLTLEDQRLQSGTWVLARATVEDRSLLPKPVRWFKLGGKGGKLPVHPATAHEEGGSCKMREHFPKKITIARAIADRYADAGLIAEDGNVLADLGGEIPSEAVIRMV